MKQFRCTHATMNYLYSVEVVADDDKQAREFAATEANAKWSGYGLASARWNVAVVKSSVSGPARILKCEYHNK